MRARFGLSCLVLRNGLAVFLEDADRLGHLADLVLAADEGNFDVEAAVGDLPDRARDLKDRRAEMNAGDIGTETGAGAEADDGDQRDQHEDGVLECLEPAAHIGEVRLVDVDHRIDLLLEGFAVGAVRLVVALLVGRFRAFLGAQARGLRSEGLEFGGAGEKLVEGGFLIGAHQRRPGGKNLVHFAEIFHQAIGKLLGAFDVLGAIDAA